MLRLKQSRWQRQPPSLPSGIRIYAIGDVHGCADLLRPIFEKIDDDSRVRPASRTMEVFLGDYVDRGPSSRDVLDLLVKRREQSETVFLKGNHETFIPQFLQNPSALTDWRRMGGIETLMSYGISPSFDSSPQEQDRIATEFLNTLPASHWAFLQQLKMSFTVGDYYFVHAGVRPGISLASQREHDMLWIRDEFLSYDYDFDKVIVHGHTPVAEPDIRFNRINIDTGAFATGRLTCLVLEASDVRLL